MTDDEILALADRMFRSIEDGDLETLRSCYHDDIVVWGNFSGEELGLDRSIEILQWLCRKLDQRRYDVTRREVIRDGFLQQHVLRGVAPDGTEIAMPACLVVTVRGDRISHIDEYLDPSAMAPAFAG